MQGHQAILVFGGREATVSDTLSAEWDKRSDYTAGCSISSNNNKYNDNVSQFASFTHEGQKFTSHSTLYVSGFEKGPISCS